jgi:hypothetical protein
VSSPLELLMLWFMMAAMVGMVVVSVRARSLEKEQGLASSARRLVAVSVLCAIAVLLVLGTTVSALLPFTPHAVPEPTATPKPIDPVEQAQLDALEKRRAELHKEIARIDSEIEKLSPIPPTVEERELSRYGVDVGTIAHFLVPILVMLGTVGPARSMSACSTSSTGSTGHT